MHVMVVGVDGRTTTALRERLTAAPLGPLPAGWTEAARLQTCERCEVYAATTAELVSAAHVAALKQWALAAAPDAQPYVYADEAAALHLARVAAGLESRVVGEAQILGQVRRALDAARAQGTAGPALAALFTAAVRAGKRARAETDVARRAPNLGAAAIAAAAQFVGPVRWPQARTLVIGAGEMAALATQALRARGAGPLAIINRSAARAQALAAAGGGTALAWEALEDALAAADVVVAATGAPEPVVAAEVVARALSRRPLRPLLLLDLGLPRNIAPEAGRLPPARLLGLEEVSRANPSAAPEAVAQAAAIAIAEARRFERQRAAWETEGLLAALRAQAEATRQAELARTLRAMPDLTERQRRRVEALTNALVNRLLHTPTLQVRARAAGKRGAAYRAAARALFGLDEGEA